MPQAARSNAEQASIDLRAWMSKARRCRLEAFKKLSTTIKDRFDAAVRGVTDHRSNAFAAVMNDLLQQAKRAARRFRTAGNFIGIAYLAKSKLTHLPTHPFSPTPSDCDCWAPHETSWSAGGPC